MKLKKSLNPKKVYFWVILSVITAALIITIILINHFNSVDIGIIGGADGPTSIIVSTGDNPVFEAMVLRVEANTILAEPSPNSAEIRSADKISIPLENIDEDTRSRLKAGVKIIVEYDGMLQETYPAQISRVYNIHIAE